MNTDYKLTPSIIKLAGATGLLLLIPLIAMQFTAEVNWTLIDFIIAGTFLFGTGLAYKLITCTSKNTAYRVAIGFALFTGLFLLWVNGAVGIIGTETNPINTFYFGVIAVGIIGGLTVRFQPKGMIYTMLAMAFTQAVIASIALTGGFYQSPPSSVIQIIGINGFFIFLFIVSALLFLNTMQDEVI